MGAGFDSRGLGGSFTLISKSLMGAGLRSGGLGGSFTLHSSRRGEVSAGQGGASLPSAAATEPRPRAGAGGMIRDLWLC